MRDLLAVSPARMWTMKTDGLAGELTSGQAIFLLDVVAKTKKLMGLVKLAHSAAFTKDGPQTAMLAIEDSQPSDGANAPEQPNKKRKKKKHQARVPRVLLLPPMCASTDRRLS